MTMPPRRAIRHALGLARQFAAWLSLVPRQNPSGRKDRIGGISNMATVTFGGFPSLVRQQGSNSPVTRYPRWRSGGATHISGLLIHRMKEWVG